MHEPTTITYLNNDGGGFAEPITLEPGTTVARFFEKKGVETTRYKIRLRRKDEQGQLASQTPTADTVLQAGDCLSCVPLKAEGAWRR